MSQAGGRGQEKRPAIGPDFGRTACGKRKAPAGIGNPVATGIRQGCDMAEKKVDKG
ncbi:hypothetical protein ABC970_21980 [Bacillus licheniformis]|uniref:hypothetical protein n=1 Tax=Bacillus TaxID=1386 RepID=UPI000A96644A|nr:MULTISPECIES: hypothetical protein [Bacillus]ASK26292.1 hypothetical protein BSSX_p0101 [Bacillus subtilis]MCQ5304510.1 hypothetical protein [Bacillus licheniformis]MDM5287333.1 hypothetical protein [Bacillus licheniformis]MDN5389935.1 hypothetical protein [Bacillus sp. LB7]MEC0776970.1 hypothetical protein [Bacillus licheniformis]